MTDRHAFVKGWRGHGIDYCAVCNERKSHPNHRDGGDPRVPMAPKTEAPLSALRSAIVDRLEPDEGGMTLVDDSDVRLMLDAVDSVVVLREALDLIRRCVLNSRHAPNVLDTISFAANRALNDDAIREAAQARVKEIKEAAELDAQREVQTLREALERVVNEADDFLAGKTKGLTLTLYIGQARALLGERERGGDG